MASRGLRGGLAVAVVAAAVAVTALGSRSQLAPPPPDTEAARPPADVIAIDGAEAPDPALVTRRPEVAVVGSWAPVPAAPIAPRWGAHGTWTGTEMLVWGGYGARPPDGDDQQDADPRTFPPTVRAGLQPLADGAAFDPAADRWRTLAPFPGTATGDEHAVWNGRELIVVGGQVEQPLQGWAYDPGTDAWRSLPPAPVPIREGQTVLAAGDEVFVWGGFVPAGAHNTDGLFSAAVYNPTLDAWRLTRPSPPARRFVLGAWTGEEVLLIDHLVGVAYDPARDTWRKLSTPPAPMRGYGRDLAVVDGMMLVAGAYPQVGAVQYGYRYLPADDLWVTQPLLEVPRGALPSASATAVGDRVAVLHAYPPEWSLFGEGLLWRARDGGWERMTRSPVADRRASTQVWTGEELVVWGGIGDGRLKADGAAWRLSAA